LPEEILVPKFTDCSAMATEEKQITEDARKYRENIKSLPEF
jgi:hypothetical protein